MRTHKLRKETSVEHQLSTTRAMGALIREKRKEQGLAQAELAGLSGVGVTFLSQLENGKETAEVGKVLNVLAMLGIDVIGRERE